MVYKLSTRSSINKRVIIKKSGIYAYGNGKKHNMYKKSKRFIRGSRKSYVINKVYSKKIKLLLYNIL